jgi:hypothetical protein
VNLTGISRKNPGISERRNSPATDIKSKNVIGLYRDTNTLKEGYQIRTTSILVKDE